VFAGIEWENVNVAGAFVVGAVLATIATLRVVRAVTSMFAGEMRRGRPPRPIKELPDDDDPRLDQ
jgi:hypothetical protein